MYESVIYSKKIAICIEQSFVRFAHDCKLVKSPHTYFVTFSNIHTHVCTLNTCRIVLFFYTRQYIRLPWGYCIFVCNIDDAISILLLLYTFACKAINAYIFSTDNLFEKGRNANLFVFAQYVQGESLS